MAAPEVTMLDLDKVTVDLGVSARASPVCTATVAAYAEALKDGADFPPVVVYRTADKTFLCDGFQRYHAFRTAGRKSLPCIIILGTHREAALRAAGSNLRNGLQRSAADRRLSVLKVLQDDEGKDWPNVKIAAHCGVGNVLVAAIRAMAKSGTTAPADVLAAKVEHASGGNGMPQRPAQVYNPAPAAKTQPARPAAPAPAPAPRAAPAPRPSTPKPPVSANPWIGSLDPEPDTKYAPPAPEPEDEEEEDGYDAEEDDGEVLDDARLRERMLRSGRKFARYVLQSGLDPHEALDDVLEDMRRKAIVAARRGRPERPKPDSHPDGAGG